MKHERHPENRPNPLPIERVVERVREIMNAVGSVEPTVLVEGEKGGRVIIMTELGDTADERANQMYQVGLMVGQSPEIGRVLQVTFVSECWLSGGESFKQGMSPSQDPNRRECVLIARERLQPRSSSIRLLEILRDPAGRYRALRPLETDVNEEMMLNNPLMDAFVLGYWTGSSDEYPFNPLAKRH